MGLGSIAPRRSWLIWGAEGPYRDVSLVRPDTVTGKKPVQKINCLPEKNENKETYDYRKKRRNSLYGGPFRSAMWASE